MCTTTIIPWDNYTIQDRPDGNFRPIGKVIKLDKIIKNKSDDIRPIGTLSPVVQLHQSLFYIWFDCPKRTHYIILVSFF